MAVIIAYFTGRLYSSSGFVFFVPLAFPDPLVFLN
jgi:hypothetical protein